ncbi:MAG TPA: DUF3089 domain-containing protein [Chitinophagaceae bacterium]|nr:DUF3089 domain-containing protein [Chitinophagaceae bacterium]
MNFYLKVFLSFAFLILLVDQSFSQTASRGNRFRTSSGDHGETPLPPDYSSLRNWASHPLIHDMGDSIPRPLRKEYFYDSTIDVFFIHPTTYLRKINDQMNGDVNNEAINDRTNNRTILNQASAFNEFRLFAPRYRQANYSAYLNILGNSQPYFDTAYADVKKAFQYYLAYWNQGRPFFVASHSQGSQHAARLIRELVEGKDLEKKLITAYVIGMPPVKTGKLNIPVCRDSTQTGCYIAWNAFTEEFRQQFNFLGKTELETVNPLTWKTSTAPAPNTLHKGAVVNDFNSVKPQVLSAQIKEDRLVVFADPDGIDMPGRIENLHTLDINLFYVDIRTNLRTRAAAYKKKNRSM